MREVTAFCKKWDMLPAGGLVLCAVSGGRDSMALLQLLDDLAAEQGFSLAAAHYNHHLRPTADRDEAFVRDWCARRQIPLHVGGGDVAAYAREEGLSQEDAARTLRYAFLEETAAAIGAARIATAHHLQDNAETVLLHLLRGSGLRGLAGIPPVRGIIVRPLLETERAVIDRYVAEKGIPYVEDETNADPAYTRNALRLRVMPLLEELNPGSARCMARTAALLREDEAYLSDRARTLLPSREGEGFTIPVPVLRGEAAAVARRLVREAARELGVMLSAEQTCAVLSLASGGYADLPGGLCAYRKPHLLRIEKKKTLPGPMLLTRATQIWGPWLVRVEQAGPEEENGLAVLLDPEKLTGPITIAPWDGTGRLAVGNGRRTAKRLFADRGIPVEERANYPALYMDGALIALFGVAVDAELAPKGGGLLVSLERRGEP